MAEGQILERVVVHAGKTFLRAGEARTDSFIIQEGEIVAFVVEKGERVEIERYGPGHIIAETNLLLDEQSRLNYEASINTTVVKITRQDFEKKIKKLDSTIFNVITHLVKKLRDQEKKWLDQAVQAKHNDFKAMEIVEHLLRDMSKERRNKYQEILLPHFNIMVKALEDLKREERTARQKKALDEKLAELKEEETVE